MNDGRDFNVFQPSAERSKARIQVTPMVNLLLFLLMVFSLFALSLVRIQSMEVKMPFGWGCGHTVPIVLQVSNEGTVYVDREATGIDSVPQLLLKYRTAMESDGKCPRVLITGDDRAHYGNFIKMIDYAKSSGIKNIIVETAYRESGK